MEGHRWSFRYRFVITDPGFYNTLEVMRSDILHDEGPVSYHVTWFFRLGPVPLGSVYERSRVLEGQTSIFFTIGRVVTVFETRVGSFVSH